MGLAALILGCGDAFHLVPRVLNYFIDADFTAALGIGKLVTSVSMTVFYILLYDIWRGYYREPEDRRLTAVLWGLMILRIALCLFPQNGWTENSSDITWGIIRNVPFTAIGALVCLLSFLFYLPVAVGAGAVPILGMLMLPKTVCYILMIIAFLRAVTGGKQEVKDGGSAA